MEVPMDQTKVPHYLPGTNPFEADFAKKFGLPPLQSGAVRKRHIRNT